MIIDPDGAALETTSTYYTDLLSTILKRYRTVELKLYGKGWISTLWSYFS